MAQPDRETGPHFSQPVRQITLMLIVLGLTGAGAFLAMPAVWPIFAPNPWLNGVILFVFVIGVVACFYQVVQLVGFSCDKSAIPASRHRKQFRGVLDHGSASSR